MRSIDTHFFCNTLKIESPSLRKGLSLISSYLIVFALIIGALFFIVPAFIDSISDMAKSLTGLYNTLINYVNTLSERYPNPITEYIQTAILDNKDNVSEYAKYFNQWAAELAPNIATASMSFIKWFFNLIVAIIVSIYMLLDANILKNSFQRIIFAIFDKKKAEYTWDTIKKANDIFSGFIIGKTIDSLIIGVLCLILMTIFDIGGSYIIVISIFVGITNMIPYFGPFLGAIPSAIIILLSVSPEQCFAFVILILALQQFDGNILGPYILGDKTGLRPIWIIFAITVGGWLGGVIGMFLGVPCVAVISSILDDVVKTRLEANGVDIPKINETKSPSKTINDLKTKANKILTALHLKKAGK